jgi:peptidoglycan/LPS O-acetylase OafA/YrhL
LRAGNLLGGWSKDSFLDGGARVAYSFLAGLALYRFNWVIKNHLSFPVLAGLLLLAFIMPWTKWNWLTESLVVLFYFPLLVALGAGSSASGFWKKFCRFSGNISYPLYMTHYTAIWIFGNYLTTEKPAGTELMLVIVSGVLLQLLIAYLTMRFLDIPIRKYLSGR